jgi:hypothetical protein
VRALKRVQAARAVAVVLHLVAARLCVACHLVVLLRGHGLRSFGLGPCGRVGVTAKGSITVLLCIVNSKTV